MTRSPSPVAPRDYWDLDRDDRMVLLWGDGLTYAQIARRFNTSDSDTRNCILTRLAAMERAAVFPKVVKWSRYK